jgi:cytochrome c
MDSLDVNKAVAAVLLAGIGFMGATLLSDALVSPKPLTKTAIAVDMSVLGGTQPAAPVQDPPVALELASASPQAGDADTKKVGCVACHSFNEGGHAGVGPNLYGVVGAPHGHMAGFAYSDALKSKQGPWTYAELYEWLKKPSAYAPGTKMTFAGLADPKERADIIDYLHTLSASPEPLPKPTAQELAQAKTAPAANGATGGGGSPASIDERLAQADPKRGEADTKKVGCVACHSFNEGGHAIIGPNLYNVVGGPHAHMPGFAYSDALKSKQGPWTFAELDQWLTKPSAYAPGTKMTFAGVSDPQERADIIDYLRSLSAHPLPLPGAKGAGANGAGPTAAQANGTGAPAEASHPVPPN